MTEFKSLRMRLGANLRAYREREQLSQERLAQKIELTPRYLAGIERGERNMSLDSIDALARRLGIDATELLIGPTEKRSA